MSVGMLQVTGVGEAIRELGKVDPEARRELQRTIRAAMKPMEQTARAYVPLTPPVVGWGRGGRLGWSSKARTGIQIKVGASRDRRGNYRLVALVQKDAAGSVFDIAGRRSSGKTASGGNLIDALNRHYGRASRSLWRAAEQHTGDVIAVVTDAYRGVAVRLNKRLA